MKPKQDMPSKNGPSPDELDAALAIAEDLLFRAQIPFIVLGETLLGVLEERLTGDKIELGIHKRYLTGSTKSMLEIISKMFDHEFQVGEDKIILKYKDVPIEIKIIGRKYDCLENPDTRFYKVTEYLIPNPIDDYLKIRGLIK